jgi:hypothetical protein
MAEINCGKVHDSIEEAIQHARQNLQIHGLDAEPFWGMRANRNANFGNVIGYQTVDKQRRWRLDRDPKGTHVNEEDFTSEPARKVRHDVRSSNLAGDLRVMLWWKHWTSRYDKPPELLEREAELSRK